MTDHILKLADVLKFISPRLTDCSFRGALVNLDTNTPKPRNQGILPRYDLQTESQGRKMPLRETKHRCN